MHAPDHNLSRLLQGVRNFRERSFRSRRGLYQRLSQGQRPHTCLLTCSDSRIDPHLLTGCEPGELFVIRNAGNLVPRHDAAGSSEAAAIEFALSLGVRDLVLCGHSHCGLVQGLLDSRAAKTCGSVGSWMRHAEETRRRVRRKHPQLTGSALVQAGVEENIRVQLEHLRTIPAVAEREKNGDLRLHGWMYPIESGRVLTLDFDSDRFVPIAAAEQVYVA